MIAFFKIIMLVALACAQNPLPGIVFQYVEDFRSDFDVRDADRNDYRPLLANVVRLAFHYCVGEGGCDGCIDMNHPDNAGLDLSVNYLDAKVPAWLEAGLSKADLYALASVVAANMALGNAGWDSDLSNFEIGRTDCDPTEVAELETFPDSHVSPFAFFEENFGFSARETTVIMGAHTLGRSQIGNSGFTNFWTQNALELGNEYYVALERPPWRQIMVPGGTKFQWDQPPPPGRQGAPLLALNADMFLIRNAMPNADGREIQCPGDFRQCMAAETRPIVQSFTTPQGQAQFQEEFKEVYLSMLRSAGQGFQQDLQFVCDVYDCSSTDVPEVVAPEEPQEPQVPQIPEPPVQGPNPQPPVLNPIPQPPVQGPGPQPPVPNPIPQPPVQGPGPQPPVPNPIPQPPVQGPNPQPPQGKGAGQGKGKGGGRGRRLL